VPRRSAVRLVVALAPALILVGGIVALVITTHTPNSTQSLGPQLPGPPLMFPSPNATYTGDRIWYNFTVTVDRANLTWAMLQFHVTPGPLTRDSANWTLNARDSGSVVVAAFSEAGGNWTTDSASFVSTGETIVLETDSPLTMGAFGVSCPTLGPGNWTVGLS